MTPNLLILGGTAEASALAARVAEAGLTATLSLAGRVARPKPQALPLRVGGFGGADGLAAYLRLNTITHLIDATHPFADQMSRNAVAASEETGVPLIALTRAPWTAGPGDDWTHLPDIPATLAALDRPKTRIMLALGRQNLPAFAAAPHHFYLLRLVDPPETPPPLPDHHVIVDRGPFTEAGDLALMRDHRIDLIICKNSGGTGAAAKLAAARSLGLPVWMIDRPALPARRDVASVDAVMDWLAHSANLGV
ncbi:cobalt-precorrin-6A reductase [Paracoccaceae bacterium GXU_MW_L88]